MLILAHSINFVMFRRYSLLESSAPSSTRVSANRLIPLVINQSKSSATLEPPSPQKSPQFFAFGTSSIFNFASRSLPIDTPRTPPSPTATTANSSSPWYSRLRNSFRKGLLRRAYSLNKDKSNNVI